MSGVFLFGRRYRHAGNDSVAILAEPFMSYLLMDKSLKPFQNPFQDFEGAIAPIEEESSSTLGQNPSFVKKTGGARFAGGARFDRHFGMT